MEDRRTALAKKLIWRKEEEAKQGAKQSQGKAVIPMAPGVANGVAATRQWQMVNRNDKPKTVTKTAEPVVQPIKAQEKAAPQTNAMSAYAPLVKIGRSLPTISPAYKLTQEPLYNSRDAANLYDALSRQLDEKAMDTINGYYARLAGEKLKGRGLKNPSGDLTLGLAQAWLGRRPTGAALDALMHYPDSKQVLEELLGVKPGLGNMSPRDLLEMINYEYQRTVDETLPLEDRARAMNRLGIYEQEALVNRGMTQEELEGVKLSNKVSDENKDFVMLDENDPGDGSVINIGVPKEYLLQGFKKPKNQPYTVYGPKDDELFLGTFEEGLEKILAYGDRNPPDETLNFENGLMYAMAYNNAPEAKTDKRDDYLMDYEEKTGISFDFETATANEGTPEEKSVRYDPKNYNESDVKNDTGRCASFVGGSLRAMGLKLQERSLSKIDQLHAELTGGTYRGVTYPQNPQVRGVIRLYAGGPMSENGTLSIKEQYDKLAEAGIVKPGDVVFMSTDNDWGDLSHGGVITRADAGGIFYSGETTARYNYYLPEYFKQREKDGIDPFVEIVVFYHSEDEPFVPDVGEYNDVDENGKGRG